MRFMFSIIIMIIQHYFRLISENSICKDFFDTFYHRTHRMETRFLRLLANYERDSKYYRKVFLSLSDSFCFVYLGFLNF